jgi:hypothetical protein
MPYVKQQNGAAIWVEPNPKEEMIKLFNSAIALFESDLDNRPKEAKQVDINKMKKFIEEESE